MTAATTRPSAAAVRSDLTAGLGHHRAGRFGEAGACYAKVLQVDPDNIDGHHLAGLLALGQADHAAAADHFTALARLKPRVAEHRSNLGHALRLLGRLDRAEDELRQATALDPGLADGWINLGLVRLDRGDADGAIAALEIAAARAPRSALAHLNLGAALQRRGRLAEALERIERAIELAPDLAPAYRNAGMVAHLLGRPDRAVAAYRRALALIPDDPDVLTNLAVALSRAGDLRESLEVHQRAIAVGPHLAEVWLNRGTTLQAMGRLADAEASFTRAGVLDPGPKPLTALGSVAAERGDFSLAVIEHQRAVSCDPEFADGHWNLALALLGAGELGRGWDEYEWRWRASSRPADLRSYPWPAWRGEPLDGRRVLVWREQGLGDELLFLSCLGDLLTDGALVTVAVSRRLVGLIRRSYPGADVIADEPAAVAGAGEFDYQVPLGTLPRFLRRTRTAFAERGGYLEADPAQVAKWRSRLDALGPGRRVGLCWRSGLLTAERRRHYPPLEAWAPLWRVPGVVWVNLQYDDCEGELRIIEEVAGVRVHRWAGEDLRDDLDSVTGLIAALDAVVTAPTAVSSLAGGVGTRAWQVDSGSDWTALGEDRSPWTPSLRVIRKAPGETDWDGAIGRLAATLGRWAEEGTTTA